jgi:hypothetical protein
MPSYFYSELPIEQKNLVIERFLALPCFATVASIESVIGLLSVEWRTQIKQASGKQSLKEYVFELLEMCATREGGFSVLLEAVRFYDGGTHQYAALIGKLVNLGLRDSFPTTCWTNVPPCLMVFAGRDTELEQLHDALTTGGGRAAICAIHGMGGVGKTNVPTEYVHRYRDLYGIVG